MALKDNLTFDLKPVLGQTVPTERLNGSTFAGTGTATLIDDPTYGPLWRVTGGDISGAITTPGTIGPTAGTPVVVVYRFRITNRQANYARFLQIGKTNPGGSYQLTNLGLKTGDLRAQELSDASGGVLINSKSYVNGSVVTFVSRYTGTARTQGIHDLWVGQGGPVGTTPEKTASGSQVPSDFQLDYFKASVTTETLDVLRVALFVGDATDAECAALAEDIDGFLDAPSGPVTHSSTGSLVSSPATIAATSARTGSAVTHASTGALVSGSSSIAATASRASAGFASLSTPPIKNNTGTVRASTSGWTINVFNVSTGALVVQKTGLSTDASGVIAVSDAALVSGTSYAYEPVHATYGRGLPIASAA